jgi:TetR/AcrR family transcriptional regulator, tetracycline repressor protein
MSRPRATLTRDAIVAVAVDLLDEAGPDALTMRAVATRLGSGVMSLYRHVTDREELLDLVLAVMAADVPMTPATGDWRQDLANIARDVRAGVLRRPHLTVLLTSRAGAAAGTLPALERTIGILRGAGFTPREAVLVNHALGNLVAGAALWEAVGLGGARGEDREARRAEGAERTGRLSTTEYPNLAWAAAELYAGTAEDRFEFGLERLLDGVAGLLEAGRS